MKYALTFFFIYLALVSSAQIQEFDITLNAKAWIKNRSFLLDTATGSKSNKYYSIMPGVEIFFSPKSSLKIMYSFASQKETYIDTSFSSPYLDAYKKSILNGIIFEGRRYFFAGRIQPYLNLPVGIQFSKTQFDLEHDGDFEEVINSAYLQVSPEIGISWRIIPLLRISAAYSPYIFSLPLRGNNKKLSTEQLNQINLGVGFILFRHKEKSTK